MLQPDFSKLFFGIVSSKVIFTVLVVLVLAVSFFAYFIFQMQFEQQIRATILESKKSVRWLMPRLLQIAYSQT